MASTPVHRDSSEESIVSFCADPPQDLFLRNPAFTNSIIRLSGLVIKYGPSVRATEAENQRRAREMLNPDIVYVPEVYRYYNDARGFGHLLMEYVEGKPISSVEEFLLQATFSKILAHFASLSSPTPGPLAGGCSPAIIFGEADEPTFSPVTDIEDWINDRLLPKETPIVLKDTPLQLCHLDLAPRNLLQLNDGSICLLDWATAGYYPWFFELCNQKIMACQSNKFDEQLITKKMFW